MLDAGTPVVTFAPVVSLLISFYGLSFELQTPCLDRVWLLLSEMIGGFFPSLSRASCKCDGLFCLELLFEGLNLGGQGYDLIGLGLFPSPRCCWSPCW